MAGCGKNSVPVGQTDHHNRFSCQASLAAGEDGCCFSCSDKEMVEGKFIYFLLAYAEVISCNRKNIARELQVCIR